MFYINSLLKYKPFEGESLCARILWIHTGGSVVVFNVNVADALPSWTTLEQLRLDFGNEQVTVLAPEEDTFIPSIAIEGKDKVLKSIEEYWNIVRPLVQYEDGTVRTDIFYSKLRGPLIAQAAEHHNKAKRLIYMYLRRYWRGGQVKLALQPLFHKRGGAGKERVYTKRPGRPSALAKVTGENRGVILNRQMRRIFATGLKKYFETQQRKSLPLAFQNILERYFHQGFEAKNGVVIPVMPPSHELPTLSQFKNWYYKERDVARVIRSRHGDKAFELNSRALLGDVTANVPGPGFLAQIDATIGDVYLVSSRDRLRIIGRPVIYVVIDVFSRMIIGFSVSLEGPSWLGALLALESVGTDKVSLCSEFEIEIEPEEWPCREFPKGLLGDRGEIEGYNATDVVDALGMQISNTPPYRADWKSLVERYFRILNDKLVRWIPGAVYESIGRGGPDYRLDACLNLYEFRRLIIYLILYYNHQQRITKYEYKEFVVEDKVEPYPIEIWNWGIENRTGYLRQLPRDLVRAKLLPQDEATVTAGGIRFNKRYYICDKAIAENWAVRARNTGVWKVPISYDPRNPKTIYLRLPGQEALIPCNLLTRSQEDFGIDWAEILDYYALELQKKEVNRSEIVQSQAELHARIEDVVSKAVEATKEAKTAEGYLSKAQRVGGIRSNRTEEREREREEFAWQLGDDTKTNSNPATGGESTSGELVQPSPLSDEPEVPPTQPDTHPRQQASVARPKYLDQLKRHHEKE